MPQVYAQALRPQPRPRPRSYSGASSASSSTSDSTILFMHNTMGSGVPIPGLGMFAGDDGTDRERGRRGDDEEEEEEDDSIVLSDLVRIGEASRLRRRGAMRIDQSSLNALAEHMADVSNGGGGVGGMGLRWRDGEVGQPWDGFDTDRWARQQQQQQRQQDESEFKYTLICGVSTLQDAEERVQSLKERFEPSILPRYAPSTSAYTSASLYRSTGCGSVVHCRAAPQVSAEKGKWHARTPSTDVVLPLDAMYFDEQQARHFAWHDCGCVTEGIGCAVCGNVLGTRYVPCALAAQGRWCSARGNKRPQRFMNPCLRRSSTRGPWNRHQRNRTSSSPFSPQASSSSTPPAPPSNAARQYHLATYTFFPSSVTSTPPYDFPEPAEQESTGAQTSQPSDSNSRSTVTLPTSAPPFGLMATYRPALSASSSSPNSPTLPSRPNLAGSRSRSLRTSIRNPYEPLIDGDLVVNLSRTSPAPTGPAPASPTTLPPPLPLPSNSDLADPSHDQGDVGLNMNENANADVGTAMTPMDATAQAQVGNTTTTNDDHTDVPVLNVAPSPSDLDSTTTPTVTATPTPTPDSDSTSTLNITHPREATVTGATDDPDMPHHQPHMHDQTLNDDMSPSVPPWRMAERSIMASESLLSPPRALAEGLEPHYLPRPVSDGGGGGVGQDLQASFRASQDQDQDHNGDQGRNQALSQAQAHDQAQDASSSTPPGPLSTSSPVSLPPTFLDRWTSSSPLPIVYSLPDRGTDATSASGGGSDDQNTEFRQRRADGGRGSDAGGIESDAEGSDSDGPMGFEEWVVRRRLPGALRRRDDYILASLRREQESELRSGRSIDTDQPAHAMPRTSSFADIQVSPSPIMPQSTSSARGGSRRRRWGSGTGASSDANWGVDEWGDGGDGDVLFDHEDDETMGWDGDDDAMDEYHYHHQHAGYDDDDDESYDDYASGTWYPMEIPGR